MINCNYQLDLSLINCNQQWDLSISMIKLQAISPDYCATHAQIPMVDNNCNHN